MANVSSFFKFLEDKVGKEIPFIVRLIYYPQSLSQEELVISGNLNLDYVQLQRAIPAG